MTLPPRPADAAEQLIDEQLGELYARLLALPPPQMTAETVWAFIRAAYGQGYVDALQMPDARERFEKLGYRLPAPLPPPPDR